MKMFLRVVFCVFLAASTANAGEQVTRTERQVYLNAIAGNAAAGARTFVLPLSATSSLLGGGAYQMAVLHFNANYTDGMTAVGMTCSSSDDAGTNLFVLQDCSTSSGACTSNDASWAKAISAADKKWSWRVDVTGYTYASCVVTITGGTANETLTVSGYLTTK